MNIYHSLNNFNPVKNLVVTIGTFDGVHLGHKKLIERVSEIASDIGGESLILSFFPHPRMILYPDEHGVEMLTTIREKIALLTDAGIGHLVIHSFDKAFSELDYNQFLKQVIVDKLHTKRLVIGHDHRFGKHREGNFEKLLEFGPQNGFEVEKIPEEDVNNIAVSSTQIRKALKAGKIETAKAFLGRLYSLTGLVVHGKKIGRTIGYPTANIHVPEDYKLIPAEGVYITEVILKDEVYFGMLNIGRRPTIEENGPVSIEVYILNFNREIYGEELTVKFMHRIRDDMKFTSVDELTAQIKKDHEFTLEYLKKAAG